MKAREIESTHEYPALEASTEFAVAVVSEENHPPQFMAGPSIQGQVGGSPLLSHRSQPVPRVLT